MGIPRVMGDATLLPNGDVVLLNGAQVRTAARTTGLSARTRWRLVPHPTD